MKSGKALAALTLLFLTSSASAHSFYELECCHDKDCAPVEDGGVKETPSGYVLPDGSTIPYGDKRIRFSPDSRFHWCHGQPVMGQVSTICLYIPGRGI